MFVDVFVDCANGISFFPDASRAMAAVSSGQRHYDLPDDMRDEDDESAVGGATSPNDRNALEVYEFSGSRVEAEAAAAPA